MTFVNRDQAEFWSAMASTWAEMDRRLERTAGDAGRKAMDRLDARPGDRLLDIGCGTGPTTVELAARVSPGGSVVGVDIAEEMLVRARRRAAEVGVDNVEFLHADVQAHDFGRGAYDGVFSRFGVMFYADPVEAFANVRQALRPGGRLSFACWQSPLVNEWMTVPAMAVMSVTGAPPPAPQPGEPGPFSLCDASRVRSVLGDAGFSDIDVSPNDDHVTADEAEIPDFADTALRTGAARQALEGADDTMRDAARRAVVDALRSKTEAGQLRLRRGVFLVTATV